MNFMWQNSFDRIGSFFARILAKFLFPVQGKSMGTDRVLKH